MPPSHPISSYFEGRCYFEEEVTRIISYVKLHSLPLLLVVNWNRGARKLKISHAVCVFCLKTDCLKHCDLHSVRKAGVNTRVLNGDDPMFRV